MKVQVKIYFYCPCCNKDIKEETMELDLDFKRTMGRFPVNMPCIDCWNREMGLFGDGKEKAKSKKERMLEEDEKDMHTGEGDDSVDEEVEETSKEEQEEEAE